MAAVDIYISERKGGREIRIPWLPEAISAKSGGVEFATYSLMDKGKTAIPTGSGLSEWSWSGILPGKNRKNEELQRGTWQSPEQYHRILEDWRKKRTLLRLLVVGYPINSDVYLSDYTATFSGGFGDMAYEVKFSEDRTVNIFSMGIDGSQVENYRNTVRSVPKTTSYTIKTGDTLWTIARQLLGDGAKWETIYNTNRDIIETTAKERRKKDSEHGRWIFPGTVITIPR